MVCPQGPFDYNSKAMHRVCLQLLLYCLWSAERILQRWMLLENQWAYENTEKGVRQAKITEHDGIHHRCGRGGSGDRCERRDGTENCAHSTVQNNCSKDITKQMFILYIVYEYLVITHIVSIYVEQSAFYLYIELTCAIYKFALPGLSTWYSNKHTSYRHG
mgnify:CR=1 FL=1